MNKNDFLVDKAESAVLPVDKPGLELMQAWYPHHDVFIIILTFHNLIPLHDRLHQARLNIESKSTHAQPLIVEPLKPTTIDAWSSEFDEWVRAHTIVSKHVFLNLGATCCACRRRSGA